MSFDESNQESNQNHSHPDANGNNTDEETNSERNEITDFELINEAEFSEIEVTATNRLVRTDYFYSQEAVNKMQRNLEILLLCKPGHIVSLDDALYQLDEQGLLKQCVEKHGAEAVGTLMRNLDFQVSDTTLRDYWL